MATMLWLILPIVLVDIQYQVASDVQGYELDPKEFVKREALEDCEALDRWEAAQAAAKSPSRHLTPES